MADTFITFSADGTAWSFAFPFAYDTNADIIVGRRTADDTYETLMESDGFRIVKNPDTDGGKIQFGYYEGATWIQEPLDAGVVLKVSRDTNPIAELTPESPMTKEQILDEFTKCLRGIAECKDDLANNVLRKFPTSFTLALQELVAADENKILFYDLTEDKIKTTTFTKEQVVLTPEDHAGLWLRVGVNDDGVVCLQYSLDGGATWENSINTDILQSAVSDYFSDSRFIEQVVDGELGYPMFRRIGNRMTFVGWGV